MNYIMVRAPIYASKSARERFSEVAPQGQPKRSPPTQEAIFLLLVSNLLLIAGGYFCLNFLSLFGENMLQ